MSRTKEELGRLAFDMGDTQLKYDALGESGRRLWDRIGQTIYDLGVIDAANAAGTVADAIEVDMGGDCKEGFPAASDMMIEAIRRLHSQWTPPNISS
jgi:hypothetical protein